MELDDKLCYCFHVTQRKVVNYIRLHKPKVPSQLSECGGAGTGCGWCVPYLKKCFAAESDGPESTIELTAEEYSTQRATYIAAGKKR